MPANGILASTQHTHPAHQHSHPMLSTLRLYTSNRYSVGLDKRGPSHHGSHKPAVRERPAAPFEFWGWRRWLGGGQSQAAGQQTQSRTVLFHLHCPPLHSRPGTLQRLTFTIHHFALCLTLTQALYAGTPSLSNPSLSSHSHPGITFTVHPSLSASHSVETHLHYQPCHSPFYYLFHSYSYRLTLFTIHHLTHDLTICFSLFSPSIITLS